MQYGSQLLLFAAVVNCEALTRALVRTPRSCRRTIRSLPSGRNYCIRSAQELALSCHDRSRVEHQLVLKVPLEYVVVAGQVDNINSIFDNALQ
jgi:hypothetical protein